MDPDLLYRVNYGPITPKEVLRLKSDEHLREAMREQAVLMDRILAAKLQSAIFSYEPSPTKGDYDYSKIMRYPAMWAEEFVLRYVWNEHYSSSAFEINTLFGHRPPMAAVISDMLRMIAFLKNFDAAQSWIGCSGSQGVLCIL